VASQSVDESSGGMRFNKEKEQAGSWRLLYRSRQFWRALTARPTSRGIEITKCLLSESEWLLFAQMQLSEQAHAIRMLERLQADGETNNDLLKAALLHDVGKSCCPLRIWERVLIVIGKKLFPKYVKIWGQGDCSGWRRAFTVAQQHPVWGAKLAEESGASEMAVYLIRHHQDKVSKDDKSIKTRLLIALQTVDDNS
jgi:hypothetical protein